MAQNYLTTNPAFEIDKTVDSLQPDKVLIVTDTNVESCVLPLLNKSKVVSESSKIALQPGEEGKNLHSVTLVWDKLEEIGATRKSLILNIGGGVVTDLGGFAAATFKRGIRTLNFPTTLLGAVDAATGGKTGIDYKGLKNEIGAFHAPQRVIISTLPFATLPFEEMLSGYAEMIKTALIADRALYFRLLDFQKMMDNTDILGKAVESCVMIKDDVVAQDPYEKGLRKILNFGHTAGHAFESLRISKNQPVSHGKAVAHGILVALVLSTMKLNFPSSELNYYKNFLKEKYGPSLIKCEEVPEIFELMGADKKNLNFGTPLFTLLKDIGVPEINCGVSEKEVVEAFDIYLELMG